MDKEASQGFEILRREKMKIGEAGDIDEAI
jgi:hypothetical protein